MITIFSTCKPFIREQDNINQYNALTSWTKLSDTEVILIGDDKGTEQAAKNMGFRFIGALDRNDHKTPLVSSLFAVGQNNSSNDLVAYVNSDIVLMNDFVVTAQVLDKEDSFMAIGQRYDIQMAEAMEFEPDWESNLFNKVMHEGKLHAPTGIDYFIFKKNTLGEIPPFALARTAWDNYLAYLGLERTGKLIDVTEGVTAIHMDHDYWHHSGGAGWVWHGPEALENRKIQDSKGVSLLAANYKLTNEGNIILK
jgi:hypothetical protein